MSTVDHSARVRRRYQLGALLVTTVAIAGVLVALISSPTATRLVPGKPVPGAASALALFAGIPQQGITLGAANAPVTLTEFGDLQCPFCAQFAAKALPSIVTRYVRSGRVRLIFRNLDGLGSDSVRAAMMAAALGHQDRLWQFIDLAYRNQGEENSGYVTDNFLRAIAQAIPGVDVDRALGERSSRAVRAQIAQAMRLADRLKLKTTPSFLLGRTGGPAHVFSPSGLDPGDFTGALDGLLRSTGR